MSKVYTKKELREEICNILNLLTIYRGYSTDEAADDILELVTPIELPTDEEIEGFAKDKINLSNDCFGQYDFTSGKQDGFIDGAIWMRDKIKGGGDE